MVRSAAVRILLVCLLLAGQAALFPLFDQQPLNPEAGIYPIQSEFVNSPDEYMGEEVVTAGSVRQTDPLVIEVQTARETHGITITNSGLTPEIGDRVRVFGTLTAPKTIRSKRAFVVPPSGYTYTYIVSFLAGLWVLGRLLRDWRVDLATLSFTRREQPLSVRTLLSGEDTDA